MLSSSTPALAYQDSGNSSVSFGTGSFFEVGATTAAAGVYGDEDGAVVMEADFTETSDHLIIGDSSFFSAFFFGRQGIQTDQAKSLELREAHGDRTP